MILTRPPKPKKLRYPGLRFTDPEREKKYKALIAAESIRSTITGEEEFEEEEDAEYEEAEKALGLETEFFADF